MYQSRFVAGTYCGLFNGAGADCDGLGSARISGFIKNSSCEFMRMNDNCSGRKIPVIKIRNIYAIGCAKICYLNWSFVIAELCAICLAVWIGC